MNMMRTDAGRIDFSNSDERSPRVHWLVNSVDMTDLFTGWSGANQGIAYAVVGGQRKMFMSSVVAGPTYTTTERIRIVEFDVTDDGSTRTPVAFSGELNVGHGQDIGVEVDGSNVIIWTTSTTAVDGIGAGKGFSRIEWKGSATSQADVTSYDVCGQAGSGHRRENLYQGSVSLTNDARYIIYVPETSQEGREHKVLIFSKAKILAASPANSLNVDPDYSWSLPVNHHNFGRIVQGVSGGEGLIHILTGYYNPLGWTEISSYAMTTGKPMNSRAICPVQAELGLGEILNSGTYTAFRIEAEGLHVIDGNIFVGMYETRHTGSSIVSFAPFGNAAYIGTGANASPHQMEFWQKTTKAATSGAYSSGATYTVGTTAFRRKSVWNIRAPRGAAGETVISPLTFAKEIMIPGPVDDDIDQQYRYGGVWRVAAYSEQFDYVLNAVTYTGSGLRVFDTRIGVDNEEYAMIERDSANKITYIRGNQTLALGPGINLHDVDHDTAAGQLRMSAIDPTGPVTRTLFFRGSSAAFYGAAGETSLGLLALPWRDVVSQKMTLIDGVAAPSTVSGAAQIYVDTADGDLKIKFGDGVTKTIMTDA